MEMFYIYTIQLALTALCWGAALYLIFGKRKNDSVKNVSVVRRKRPQNHGHAHDHRPAVERGILDDMVGGNVR